MKRILLALLFACFSIGLSAQNEHELQICNQAQEFYQLGRLDDAVRLLEDNVKGLSSLPRITALRVMALCYLEQDRVSLAESCVSQILKEDPYYNISLADPPRFVDMVERFKQGGEPTVTTASQQAESLSEVPVPVTLITEEMIRQSGARTLSELLTLFVPGMSVVEGFETNMAMHGVYSTLQEKILVMQDGHRLNSRTNNSEAFDYRTSLDKIKQIEVLRGPASCLYGNVALTAVVNIITKKGNDVDGVKATLGLGTNHTYRADFLMGKRAMEIDFLGWGSVYVSEGELRHVGVDDEEFYGKIKVPGKMYIGGYNQRPAYDLGFSAKWKDFTLMFSMQEAKRVLPYNLLLIKALYNYDRYRMFDNMKPGHSRKSTRIDLTYDKQLNEHWDLKMSAFVDMEDCVNYDITGDSLPAEFRMLPVPPGEILPPGPQKEGMLENGVYQVQSWSDYTYGFTAQANCLFNIGKWKNSLLTGLQLENYTSNDNKMLLGDHFDRVLVTYSAKNRSIDLGHELNVSPFVQLKTKFTDHFIFNGGLRFDCKHRYDDKWLTVLSPRVSFIYNHNSKANLKLSYAHSFVDAPFFYRANRINTYPGGKDLEPEHNDAVQFTFEGGLKENRFKYQSNVFYNKLNDLIYRDVQQGKYTNAGSLEIIGFEQVLSGKINRSSAYLNFTYQRVLNSSNYIADGTLVYHVPAVMFNAMYSYQILKKSKYGMLNANIVLNALSKQRAPLVGRSIFKGDVPIHDPLHEHPARAILNLSMDYHYKDISLSLDAYNILNKDYYQGGDVPIPFPQQGFNMMTTLSYHF